MRLGESLDPPIKTALTPLWRQEGGWRRFDQRLTRAWAPSDFSLVQAKGDLGFAQGAKRNAQRFLGNGEGRTTKCVGVEHGQRNLAVLFAGKMRFKCYFF